MVFKNKSNVNGGCLIHIDLQSSSSLTARLMTLQLSPRSVHSDDLSGCDTNSDSSFEPAASSEDDTTDNEPNFDIANNATNTEVVSNDTRFQPVVTRITIFSNNVQTVVYCQASAKSSLRTTELLDDMRRRFQSGASNLIAKKRYEPQTPRKQADTVGHISGDDMGYTTGDDLKVDEGYDSEVLLNSDSDEES